MLLQLQQKRTHQFHRILSEVLSLSEPIKKTTKKKRKPAINFTAVTITDDNILFQLKVMDEEKAKKEAKKEEKRKVCEQKKQKKRKRA